MNKNKKVLNVFYLDKEKDIVVTLYKTDTSKVLYKIETPNHNTGNLITSIAKMCNLAIEKDENDMKVINGSLFPIKDKYYMFMLGGMNVATFNSRGKVKVNCRIPAIIKTLMSQTKNYKLDVEESLLYYEIAKEQKLRTDLHSHLHGILKPDMLIALGIKHQIKYPLYYVRKINLILSDEQEKIMKKLEKEAFDKIEDDTISEKAKLKQARFGIYMNFADLILNNLENAKENIAKIRISLGIMKDGQAVFTNLEKLYAYRYVFTKGIPSEKKIPIDINKLEKLPDEDLRNYAKEMFMDFTKVGTYQENNVQEDMLLAIAREAKKKGITYTEISQTCLARQGKEAIECLENAHRILPLIEQETGVKIRYLAAIRRDFETVDQMLEAVDVVKAVAHSPYVVGSDILGEELNDICEMEPALKELIEYAVNEDNNFVIRIHAGENDAFRDNVEKAVMIIKNNVPKGKKYPKFRIGHGLYGKNPNTPEGKKLIQDMKEIGTVLEFNLTSNVRLNNLNNLNNCPIKFYLDSNVHCVQGTDGYGLYGTDSVEEQMALRYLLGLKDKDFMKMVKTEKNIIEDADIYFKEKSKKFKKELDGSSIEDFIVQKELENIQKRDIKTKAILKEFLETKEALKEKISNNLPMNKIPVIIAGGSFNSQGRETDLSEDAKQVLKELISQIDSKKAYFVVGHKMQGYEKALIELAKESKSGFETYAIVPRRVSEEQKKNLLNDTVDKVCVSTIAQEAGIYKSFNYEIFERQKSIVLAFDGNSPVENLIQEAKNGKAKAKIYVNTDVENLNQKANSLDGYVYKFDKNNSIAKRIIEDNPEIKKA